MCRPCLDQSSDLRAITIATSVIRYEPEVFPFYFAAWRTEIASALLDSDIFQALQRFPASFDHPTCMRG